MLEITIGAAPRRLYQPEDIGLAKAAILYADHATLVSPGACYIKMIQSLHELNDGEALDALTPELHQLRPGFLDDETLALMVRVFSASEKQLRQLPAAVRAKLEYQRHGVMRPVNLLRARLTEIANQVGVRELDRALNSGLLTLHPFDMHVRGTDDRIAEDFSAELFRTIREGRTYPLFDENVAGVVDAAISAGHLSGAAGSTIKGRQVQLAASLFRRLPAFSNASVDEVLDIRRELSGPLTRFRGAMSEFADVSRHASWDAGFPAEVDQYVIQKIEPALLEIDEQVQANSYLLRLGEQVGVAQVASGSLVAYLLDQFAASATIATAAAVGTTTALAVIRTLAESRKAKQAIEQNQLFFYYEAKKRMSS